MSLLFLNELPAWKIERLLLKKNSTS